MEQEMPADMRAQHRKDVLFTKMIQRGEMISKLVSATAWLVAAIAALIWVLR